MENSQHKIEYTRYIIFNSEKLGSIDLILKVNHRATTNSAGKIYPAQSVYAF